MIAAQFVIERHCPDEWHFDPAVRADTHTWPDEALPFCVWVELAGAPLPCGGRSFRILLGRPMVSAEGRPLTLDPNGSIPHVCEHMGHLIE